MIQKWKQFRTRHDGAVLIEFAMVAPILFATMFAIIEFGIVMLSASTLESALNITARHARTRNDAGSGDLVQHIRDEIQRRSGGLVNSGHVIITTDNVTGYDALPILEECVSGEVSAGAGGNCPGNQYIDSNGNGRFDNEYPPINLGGPGDLITLTAYYPYRAILPGIRMLIGGNKTGDDQDEIMISSTTLIKNEP